MKKSIIWILLILVVIIALILLGRKGEAPINNEPSTSTSTEDSAALKPATGNIDDITASILGEADSDDPTPLETDANLVAPEDFSDLNQSLDVSNL